MENGKSQLRQNFVQEQILCQALDYIEKDPEVNMPKILNLVKLLAIKKKHKEQVEQAALAYQQNPAIRTFVNRLFVATHPNIKHRLIYNFFINAMIFGIPQQAQMPQKHGVHVPNLLLVDPTSACNLACEGCWAGKYAKKIRLVSKGWIVSLPKPRNWAFTGRPCPAGSRSFIHACSNWPVSTTTWRSWFIPTAR
ncbi:MAG: hypothetical protein EF806_00260 [Candidatus Methanoliparum thermophilum]|uniref:Radical SAM protein n=1 Tax=Methanoliparum thermophilum TaxID=2491083 RepID=A0A520KTF9_METT2|nr:MAG: hypothetical protein EF806_00260 [Candidatus Methanoliparum thermophilum]BDC35546.1 hypothetical protein MTLP_02280 [Candidatus Methanoliparum sp. LAM-1]